MELNEQGYIITDNSQKTSAAGVYGNVVIVGYAPAINAFISLTDKQVDVILSRRKEMCPTCKMKEKLMFNRKPVKILFRKPDGDPVLTEKKKDEDIYQLLNSNHLEYTDIGAAHHNILCFLGNFTTYCGIPFL